MADRVRMAFVRLSLRVEDDDEWYVARFMEPNTTDNSLEIGRVRCSVVRQVPDGEHRFADLMLALAKATIDAMGLHTEVVELDRHA